jgi:hypothetical protein
MHSFIGIVHDEDTAWNIDQTPHSLDVMKSKNPQNPLYFNTNKPYSVGIEGG